MDIAVECYYPDDNGICLGSSTCIYGKCPCRAKSSEVEHISITVDKVLEELANEGEES